MLGNGLPQIEGFSTTWVSHIFSTSYHVVFFLRGLVLVSAWYLQKVWGGVGVGGVCAVRKGEKRMGKCKKFLWPMPKCTQLVCHKKVNIYKVGAVLIAIHHLVMSFVFSLKAVCDKTIYCRGYTQQLLTQCCCAKKQMPGSREASCAGTFLPTYMGKVATDKIYTMHNGILYAM